MRHNGPGAGDGLCVGCKGPGLVLVYKYTKELKGPPVKSLRLALALVLGVVLSYSSVNFRLPPRPSLIILIRVESLISLASFSIREM